MSPVVALLVALLLLLGNAFFVGAEFAMISARRSQIEPRAEAGSRAAKYTLKAMENIGLVIGVNQLGITVCSLVLGAVGEPAVSHLVEPVLDAAHVPHSLLHPIAFAIALLVVVYLHVVLGEMIPKNIALAGPDRVAVILAPAIWGFVTVLRPVIVVINGVAALILRLFGVRLQDEVASTFTREEVAALVEESRGEGLLADEEYDRLSGALGFTEKTVATVVLPPDTLTTVLRGSSPADVEALCASTGFSRFPVADVSGELIGYLHIKDVLEPDEARREQPIQDKWIRPFAPVTADDQLQEALETLQRRGAHMARVVDADGATLGLATLEDVIEELVGEIRDAAHHDAPHEAVLETARQDDA
ncbi:hemolysin family protein [Nocardioides sp. 503]|uniref:hemolysin family protein n=1 Tax=Nocardioides sp. 503 TaxID=2508326 RepID=UPI001070125C|nr:hemolysin family protein [Nocardioides sp. 503]